ncbi:MAG: STY0301 family protein [Burkholderiaceae bacterium]
MPDRRSLLACVLGCALASACAATPAAPVADLCPRELAVRQTVAAEVPGWTPQNQQEGYPFARIAFYLGPPDTGTRQVPTWERRDATGLHDTWRLPKQPAGYWISCEYANTTASVSRRLDDDLAWCQADYDARFATLVVRRWRCLPAAPSSSARSGRRAASASSHSGR